MTVMQRHLHLPVSVSAMGIEDRSTNYRRHKSQVLPALFSFVLEVIAVLSALVLTCMLEVKIIYAALDSLVCPAYMQTHLAVPQPQNE